MDYLDYLPDTPYGELPEAVKATISAEDYAASRQLANELIELAVSPAAALPAALQAAYHQRSQPAVNSSTESPGVASLKVTGRNKQNWRYRLSVAASLFLAATTLTLLLWQSKEKIIYKLVSAPVPEPVLLADTIYLDRAVEKVVYRDRVDTVERFLPTEPRYVYLTDTVYRPEPDSVPILNRSKPANSDTRLLNLLVPAE